jgi:hypothetical protein
LVEEGLGVDSRHSSHGPWLSSFIPSAEKSHLLAPSAGAQRLVEEHPLPFGIVH